METAVNIPPPSPAELAAIQCEFKVARDCGVVMVEQLARRWSCAGQHIIDLIDDGSLLALDLSGKSSLRRSFRIPLEAIHHFRIVNATLFDPKTGRLLAPRPVLNRQKPTPTIPKSARALKTAPNRLRRAAAAIPIKDRTPGLRPDNRPTMKTTR